MNRRGFLGLLGGFAATAILDPERLLWVRGAKFISVPNANPLVLARFEIQPMLDEIDRLIMRAYGVGNPNRRGIFPKPGVAEARAYERAAGDLMSFLNGDVVEIA
jgi:hypothetical protein